MRTIPGIHVPVFLCFLMLVSVHGEDENSAEKPTTHPEVHRAKSHIDSLLFKLHLDMNTQEEKQALANKMKEESEERMDITRKELVIAKYLQHLLDQLSKGVLDHKSFSCGASHFLNVQIRTSGSALPENYTISVQGERLLIQLLYILFHLKVCPITVST